MRRAFLGGIIGVTSGALFALSFDAFSDSEPLGNPPREGWAPDPQPIASTKQWVFEIRSKDSIPTVVKVSEGTAEASSSKPRTTRSTGIEPLQNTTAGKA